MSCKFLLHQWWTSFCNNCAHAADVSKLLSTHFLQPLSQPLSLISLHQVNHPSCYSYAVVFKYLHRSAAVLSMRLGLERSAFHCSVDFNDVMLLVTWFTCNSKKWRSPRVRTRTTDKTGKTRWAIGFHMSCTELYYYIIYRGVDRGDMYAAWRSV